MGRGKIGPVYSRPLDIFSGNVSDAMTESADDHRCHMELST